LIVLVAVAEALPAATFWHIGQLDEGEMGRRGLKAGGRRRPNVPV
jgi:hypothetical protein